MYVQVSILFRLSELVTKAQEQMGEATHQSQVVLPCLGKGGKKGDIYRLGVILLSLALGRLICEHVTSIPTHLSAAFQDFVSRCLDADERSRWSAQQLLEHHFIKMAPATRVAPARDTTALQQEHKGDVMDDEEDDSAEIPVIPTSDAHSRLKTEFVILKSLGSGAFGDVIKVKNKLDGRLYAIKRITLHPQREKLTRKITREVKLLSRLNHENVVRYYNSWMELSDQAPPSDESSSASTNTPDTGVSPQKKVEQSLQTLAFNRRG